MKEKRRLIQCDATLIMFKYSLNNLFFELSFNADWKKRNNDCFNICLQVFYEENKPYEVSNKKLKLNIKAGKILGKQIKSIRENQAQQDTKVADFGWKQMVKLRDWAWVYLAFFQMLII